MKFISKNPNLNIILRPGLQAQPLTGQPATPTIYVKFKDGLAEVDDKDLAAQMLAHPGFNQDFIAADETGTDPYAYLRDHDTQYVHTEMKYGHPTNRSASPVQSKLPPEIMKMVQEQAKSMATEMTKQMLPGAIKATLEAMAEGGQKAHEENGAAPEPTPVQDDTPQQTEPEEAPAAPAPAQPQASAPRKTATRKTASTKS